MYNYNISKYNPEFRDHNRRYQKDEWIAISDIGRVFEGVKLTDAAYMKVEDSYIQAIKQIMKFHSLPSLYCRKYQHSYSYDQFLDITKPYNHLYSEELLHFYRKFSGNILGGEEVDYLCRLQLREDVWSEIYYPRRLKIFICYDYLMGIASSRPLNKILPQIKELGLYIETH